MEQVNRDFCFILCVAAAPGSAFYFKIITEVGFIHSIQVDVELGSLKKYAPAQAIFFHFDFA